MSCLCSSHQYTSPLFIVNVVKELIVLQREIQCLYSLFKSCCFFVFPTQISSMSYSSEKSIDHCFNINCKRRNGCCSKDGSFMFRLFQPTSGCCLYSRRPASVTYIIFCYQWNIWPFIKKLTEVCRVPLRPSASLKSTTSLVLYEDSSSVRWENCALLTV